MATIELDEALRLPELAEAINKAWATAHASDLPRFYLGASMLGHPCQRYIWLYFRWIEIEKPKGQLLRLFDMGQREEDIAADNLRKMGMKIAYTGKDQMNLDYGCHMKGHPDGLILEGVPTAESTEHIWEHKTMNKANFEALIKDPNGVKGAKPLHYAQMQLEMYGAKSALGHKVNRALYMVLCKDDSRIYAERVRLDKEFAEALIARGKSIALSERMPPGLSENKGWWQCNMCPMDIFCHMSHCTTTVTCRNCCHATPKENGTWYCEIYKDTIPEEFQLKACDAHVFHPDTVPWELDARKSTEASAFYWTNKELGLGYLNGIDGIESHEFMRRADNDSAKGVPKASDSIAF